MEIPLALRLARTRVLPFGLCTAALSTAFAVHDPRALVPVFFSRCPAPVLAAFFDLVLLILIGQYLWMLRSSRRVLLLPDGIRLQEDEFRRWDEIEEVKAGFSFAGGVWVRRKSELAGYNIRWMYVGAGSRQLVDLIEYYRTRPEARWVLEHAPYPYSDAA